MLFLESRDSGPAPDRLRTNSGGWLIPANAAPPPQRCSCYVYTIPSTDDSRTFTFKSSVEYKSKFSSHQDRFKAGDIW